MRKRFIGQKKIQTHWSEENNRVYFLAESLSQERENTIYSFLGWHKYLEMCHLSTAFRFSEVNRARCHYWNFQFGIPAWQMLQKKKKSSCKGHNVHGRRRMSKEKFLFKGDIFDLIWFLLHFFLLPFPHPFLHLRKLKAKFNSRSFDFKVWIHAQQSNVQQGWKDPEFLRSVLASMVRIDHIQRIKIKHFCWFFWKTAKLL